MLNAPTPPRAMRIALALVLCGGVTTGGIFILLQKQSLDFRAPLAQTKKSVPLRDDDAFFYQSLGNGTEKSGSGPEAAPAPLVQPAGFTVELGAFLHQAEAEKLLDRLKAKGIDTYYTPLSDGGRIVYRVRKGLFPDAASAEADAGNIAKALGKHPEVVKLQ